MASSRVRRSGNLRPLSDLLTELGERADMRYGRRRLDTTEALADALRVVMGEDVSARCRPAGYSGSVAILACRSSAAAQVIAMHLPEVLAELQQRVPHRDVAELRLSVAPERWVLS